MGNETLVLPALRTAHSPTIPTLEADQLQPGAIDACLREAGAVVVRGLASAERRAAVDAELAPYFNATPAMREQGIDNFYAGDTKRLGNALSKSATVAEMVIDDTILGCMDDTLLPNCDSYQLHVCSSLNVGPGARAQVLHREDAWDEYVREWGGEFHREGEKKSLIVATMWALTDFTATNGATLIVPGSHRWSLDRAPTAEEVVSAEMEAGSVLLWLGGTLHAAGANVTENEWRRGVFISYTLGWLRTEEHFAMELTAEAAARLPEKVRKLVGFEMSGALGFFGNELHGVTNRLSVPKPETDEDEQEDVDVSLSVSVEGKVGPSLPDWEARLPPPRTTTVGQWCSLEPLSVAAHSDDLFEAYSAPTEKDLWTYTGPDAGDPTVSREVFDDWVATDASNPSRVIFAVIDAATGKAVGTCAHQAWEPAHGVIEVGHVYYGAALQRTAAATEAVYLLLKRAFDELGYRRVQWSCDALNADSRVAAG